MTWFPFQKYHVGYWMKDRFEGIQEWKLGDQMEAMAFRGTKVPWEKKKKRIVNGRNIRSK